MDSAFSTPAGKDSKNAETPCLRIMERRMPPLPAECRTVLDPMQIEMQDAGHRDAGCIAPPSHTFQHFSNKGGCRVTHHPTAPSTSVPPHQVTIMPWSVF